MLSTPYDSNRNVWAGESFCSGSVMVGLERELLLGFSNDWAGESFSVGVHAY